jgi:hypothetical protein
MISSLVSKVNPSHLADLSVRDRSAAKAAPVAPLKALPSVRNELAQIQDRLFSSREPDLELSGGKISPRDFVIASIFDQPSALAATYHFCQRPSLARLGGSHGKLRRVDAKAA